MPNQAYRLTVKEADGVTDYFVITSVRGGTSPYIAAPPSGDGQEVDLLTGSVRTGAYVVEVVDAVTGSDATGTLRVLTRRLFDGSANTARPHILSRRAILELSSDGGATWPTVWQSGYITSVEQVDAIRYAITVSDTRRIESTYQAFAWTTAAEQTAFPSRGCLFGGPIIGGFGAAPPSTSRVGIDYGGYEYSFLEKQGDVLALNLLSAYGPPPKFERTKYFPVSAWDAIRDYLKLAPQDASLTGSNFNGINDRPNIFSYPNVTVILEDSVGTTWRGFIRGLGTPKFDPDAAFGEQTYDATQSRLFVQLFPGYATWTPTAGAKVRVRGISSEVSELSPIYLSYHPVDIVTKLFTCANIAYNASSATTVKNELGPTLRLAARIEEPQTLDGFLSSAIFGPFGFSTRTNSSGEQEFFMTRRRRASSPTLTIATTDLVGDSPPPVWSLDEGTVVTGFSIEQETFSTFVKVKDSTETPPPDGIRIGREILNIDNADTSTFSTRVVSYKIPGMVHDSASFTPDLSATALAIIREGFDRFGRGAPSTEVEVLRSSAAAAAQVGDEVFLNVSFYPNRNYRIGEAPSIGPRVAQVVRREERPESILFKLVDSGSDDQPATLATITLAASTADPRRIAQFTITNAPALNSDNIAVTVEYAVSAASPTTNGITFIRYAAGAVPTAAVRLPAVLPGSRVWVRARSEQPELRPAAWSGWVDVTLTAWLAPTSVTASSITNESVALSWSLNGNTLDDVELFVAPGSVAPADWRPFRINTLPNTTTSTTVRNLTASTSYIAGVAFRDRVNNAFTTPATATFTTASGTTGTATAPLGLQIVQGVNDASLPQGIALALFPASGASQTVVERATVSGGPFTELAVLPASTTVYFDYLPRDGTTYYYRIRHRTSGQADSTATAEVSGTSTGINPVIIPSFSAPSLKAVTTPGTSSYDIVLTWDGTIVYNLDGVSQSVSGWTSPRTVNVTRSTGTATKVAAFAVSKTGVTVSESINIPPVVPTIPAITSAYFDNGFTPGDGGGSVDIIWTVSDMPSGTTYDIDLVNVTGDPITDASASYTNVTSPYTASIALGTDAEATCVIRALVGTITIATYSFRSVIPI